jgi:uncharacterized membrane protein YidH (DUF202 family)
MMGDFSLLSAVLLFLMITTVIVVIIGISRLANIKNNKDRKKNNRLMMLRISLQALIIFVIALSYFFKR